MNLLSFIFKQLEPVFFRNRNWLHGFHIHRHHHAPTFCKNVVMTTRIFSNQILLKVKRRIANSRALYSSFNLIFEVNRTQVINLDSAHHGAYCHDIPVADLMEKYRSGMLKIVEINPIVDMKVSIDIREADLDWGEKWKLNSNFSRANGRLQSRISDLLVLSSIRRIDGLYPIISTTESNAIHAREMLSSLILSGSLISASIR